MKLIEERIIKIQHDGIEVKNTLKSKRNVLFIVTLTKGMGESQKFIV